MAGIQTAVPELGNGPRDDEFDGDVDDSEILIRCRRAGPRRRQCQWLFATDVNTVCIQGSLARKPSCRYVLKSSNNLITCFTLEASRRRYSNETRPFR